MPHHLALVESSLVPLTTALFLRFLFSASIEVDDDVVDKATDDELDDCRRRNSDGAGLPPGLLTMADVA